MSICPMKLFAAQIEPKKFGKNDRSQGEDCPEILPYLHVWTLNKGKKANEHEMTITECSEKFFGWPEYISEFCEKYTI